MLHSRENALERYLYPAFQMLVVQRAVLVAPAAVKADLEDWIGVPLGPKRTIMSKATISTI